MRFPLGQHSITGARASGLFLSICCCIQTLLRLPRQSPAHGADESTGTPRVAKLSSYFRIRIRVDVIVRNASIRLQTRRRKVMRGQDGTPIRNARSFLEARSRRNPIGTSTPSITIDGERVAAALDLRPCLFPRRQGREQFPLQNSSPQPITARLSFHGGRSIRNTSYEPTEQLSQPLGAARSVARPNHNIVRGAGAFCGAAVRDGQKSRRPDFSSKE
jgi:hypothetical protein